MFISRAISKIQQRSVSDSWKQPIPAVELTHCGREKCNGRHFADAILKCIFLMKMFEFRLKFHWGGLFLRFQLTLFQHWYRYWLGAVKATSHYLNQWWLVYWRIYASLGLNEWTPTPSPPHPATSHPWHLYPYQSMGCNYLSILKLQSLHCWNLGMDI